MKIARHQAEQGGARTLAPFVGFSALLAPPFEHGGSSGEEVWTYGRAAALRQ